MPKHPSFDTRGFKVLAAIGAVVALVLPMLVLVVMFVFFHWVSPSSFSGRPMTDMGPSGPMAIGEEGNVCGGAYLLPCGAGLTCQDRGDGTGRCIKAVTAGKGGPDTDMKAADAACDERAGEVCVAPLFCKKSDGATTCAAKAQNAPHILAARFDGLQPADGSYAPSGSAQEVSVSVTAVNADAASIILIPVAGESVTQAMDKAEGGSFDGAFVLPQGFRGRLIVLVEAKDGSTNSLVKYIEAR